MKCFKFAVAALVLTSSAAFSSVDNPPVVRANKSLRAIAIQGAPKVQLLGKNFQKLGEKSLYGKVIFNVSVPAEGNLCGAEDDTISYALTKTGDTSSRFELYSYSVVDLSLVPSACQEYSKPITLSFPVALDVYVDDTGLGAEHDYVMAPLYGGDSYVIHQHISVVDQSVTFAVFKSVAQ